VTLPREMVQELLPNDEIVAINGKPTPSLESLNTIEATLPLTGSQEYTVKRNGAEVQVLGPHPFPPYVLGVRPGSAAYDVGIQSGDFILSVEGLPVWSFDQVVEFVGSGEGRPMLLSVWRNGETLDFTVVPRMTDLATGDGGFETRWLLGLSGGLVFELQTETPGLWSTIKIAFGQLWGVMLSSITGLYFMIAGDISSCNLSGPIGIAKASGAMAAEGAVSFMWFVGVISAGIGLINLFPIPVLDGGHLVFYAYEAVTGKKPAENVLNVLMVCGLVIVLLMTVFGVANDLFLCP
jgi:regulator of sigma E protease